MAWNLALGFLEAAIKGNRLGYIISYSGKIKYMVNYREDISFPWN